MAIFFSHDLITLTRPNNHEYLTAIGNAPKVVDVEKRLDCFNAKNGSGLTPLQYAMKHGAKDDTIRALVMAGADVNVCDSERTTPFLLAAKHCSTDIVKIMINNGADVTVRDKNNSTALHLAVEHNTSADVIAVLIEGGADVRALDGDQRTPLHLAILKSRGAQVVGALLVPVAGNVESHELNEFLDFVERSRGQGQGLDRLLISSVSQREHRLVPAIIEIISFVPQSGLIQLLIMNS